MKQFTRHLHVAAFPHEESSSWRLIWSCRPEHHGPDTRALSGAGPVSPKQDTLGDWGR